MPLVGRAPCAVINHTIESHYNMVQYHTILFIMALRETKQGPLSLTWIKFNHSLNKQSHTQYSVRWNYLFIPKLQWLHHWSLVMDNQFHPTLYNGSNYLSMLGLKFINVSNRGSQFMHTKASPYHTFNSKLLSVFCKYFEENRLCYKESKLHWIQKP